VNCCSNFSGDEQKGYLNYICRGVYKFVSLCIVPLADFGNPTAGKPRGNWSKWYCQNGNLWNIQDML
jgi:hypothetical protein